MSIEETQAQAARLLGSVLGRTLDPGHAVLRPAEPRWDSIRHLELVFALEDQFGVRFEASEMAAMDSLDSIVRALERHLEA
jgi:acyl carrier protein